MSKRWKNSYSGAKKYFRHTAGTQYRNVAPAPMRGGIRL